jgi:alginate O-acetyltransferase complex protein AlgI
VRLRFYEELKALSFNSAEFALFLAITYLLYRVLPFRWQNRMLLVASYIFYGWLDIRLVLLIIVSTAIVFVCGLGIAAGQANPFAPSNTLPENETYRKRFLWIGIGANLAILGFFKYFNFFVNSIAAVLGTVGLKVELLHLNLVLIAGVSFYTFKAIGYLVDVYKRKVEATRNPLHCALFLGFFPPLLAGPIDRASSLLPQIANPRSLTGEQTVEGIFLFLFGLFKKVAIADGVASSVNAVYGTSGAISWLDVILATFLYAIQIYCDFSGYSDMAIGISKLFGFNLIINFNLPYFSQNPSEFWQRWHISLSTWLRDYLYIPLGGNRQGEFATYRNLMVTMVLGGLWHGAAWNFVLWGCYQGLLLCVFRAFGPKQGNQPAVSRALSLPWGLPTTILFFAITCYGWLLFRATSLDQIVTFTRILITDVGNFSLSMPKPPLSALLGIPLLVAYEVAEYLSNKTDFRYLFPSPVRAVLYATLVFIVIMGQSNAPAQFIYSQF